MEREKEKKIKKRYIKLKITNIERNKKETI